MSTSRKRYRPLDPSEERAVTVHERLQLLPLEDEQSYCFSWPEASLTQWLQEDVPYASLYQLYANAGGGIGSGGVSSHTMRGQSSGLVDAGVASSVLDFPQGKSKVATFSSSGRREALNASSSTDVKSFSALHHQRNVEVPPVFLLDDFEPALAKHGRLLKASGDEGTASDPQYGGADLQRLLRRVRDAVKAARHDSTGTASVVKAEVFDAKDGASPAMPPPSIVLQSDATTRLIPHPLAPPRPQSIAEDSIFSLSATQLVDLVAASVPALYASAARGNEQRSSQYIEAPNTPITTSTEDLSSGEPSTASRTTGYICSCHDPQRGAELSESARREIEHEVVGLEWRTWSQSQRTAAALQRLLSLEAAVPFERGGDAQRDAWRAAVYRLWLQWRQQRLPPIPERAAAGGSAESSTRAATLSCGFSGASVVPSVPASSYGFAAFVSPSPATAALTFPEGALAPSRNHPRLPWGAPLLAGAYLYGTSNDYFISLPPSTTSAPGHVSNGGSSNSKNCGGSSLWPAMSRRRGTYSFLRWKVELYEAQLSRAAAAAAAAAEEDEENVDDGNEAVEGGKGKDVDSRDRGGSDSSTATKVRQYSKGPLGGLETDTSASTYRSRRGADDDRGGSAADICHFAGRKTATTTVASPTGHTAINGVMSVSHMKALLHTTVLTQPLTELEMDDEPTTVMERLACPDLRRDTEAWRVWLSRV